MGEAQGAGWCVVISKPSSEHIAAKSLREAGYREYLPMEQRILRGHPKTAGGAKEGTPKLYPLFPRYLFAELHDGQDWGPIKRATGVEKILTHVDFRPKLVPSGIIQAIRDAEDSGQFSERKPDGFKPGTSVRVESGPFAEMIGKIVSSKPDGRVMVLLELMMRPVPVPMRAEELRAIG